MFDFKPTYQDYLESQGGREGALSEQQWNAMPADQQWRQMGSGMALAPSDPRYSAIAQQLGVSNGRAIRLGASNQSNPFTSEFYTDPNKILKGDNVFATADDNLSPKSQFAGGGLSDREWALLAASLVGGGAVAGAYGLTGEAAGASAGASAPADSYWGALASNGATDVPVGEIPYGASTAGAAPGAADSAAQTWMLDGGEGMAGGASSGALGGTAGPGSLAPVSDLSTQASSPGLLSQAGHYVSSNPLGAARVGLGLASLGAGAISSHNSSGNNSSSGNNGSFTDPASIINAMADANRVNQTGPLGSRTWSQDANGRWTAADAYTPALQANFDAQTGMNGDIIGGARQRLAALLAQPAHRYDTPISFMQHQQAGG